MVGNRGVDGQSYHESGFRRIRAFRGIVRAVSFKTRRSIWLRMRKEKVLHNPRYQWTRVEELGPILMGQRVRRHHWTRIVADRLFEKGGYVLPDAGDADVASRDQDWDPTRRVSRNEAGFPPDLCSPRPASPDDFQGPCGAAHCKGLDLAGNHQMDWFLEQPLRSRDGRARPLFMRRGPAAHCLTGRRTSLRNRSPRRPETVPDAISLSAPRRR